MVEMRKKIKIYHEVNMDIVDKNTDIYDLEKNGILLTFKTRVGKDKSHQRINILINPSDESICYNKPNNTTIVVPPISIKVEKNNG